MLWIAALQVFGAVHASLFEQRRHLASNAWQSYQVCTINKCSEHVCAYTYSLRKVRTHLFRRRLLKKLAYRANA
jgi:hypothetical protein